MLGKSQSNLENMIRAENVPDRSVQNHKLQIQNAALKKEHSNVQVEGEGSSLLCFKKKKRLGRAEACTEDQSLLFLEKDEGATSTVLK